MIGFPQSFCISADSQGFCWGLAFWARVSALRSFLCGHDALCFLVEFSKLCYSAMQQCVFRLSLCFNTPQEGEKGHGESFFRREKVNPCSIILHVSASLVWDWFLHSGLWQLICTKIRIGVSSSPGIPKHSQSSIMGLGNSFPSCPSCFILLILNQLWGQNWSRVFGMHGLLLSIWLRRKASPRGQKPMCSKTLYIVFSYSQENLPYPLIPWNMHILLTKKGFLFGIRNLWDFAKNRWMHWDEIQTMYNLSPFDRDYGKAVEDV